MPAIGWTEVAALVAAYVIAVLATPAGISGAVLLLPFQVSVLGTPSPAVTPTNLLYNVVATPGALYRYWRQGQTGGRLALVLITGTLPGVIAGSVIRSSCCPGHSQGRLRPLHAPAGRRGLARPRAGWPIPQDGHQEPQRPGADPGRHRRPETPRPVRGRRAAGAGGDGRRVLHRGGEHGAPGPQSRYPARRSQRPGHRNVAALADTPKGQQGRPSKSLTLDQALAVIAAARTLPVMELRPGLKDVRRPAELMHAYIVLSLLSGLRTEEARALRWAHVDLDGDAEARPPVPPHVAVWRSVRVHGETKTERSRRTLGLPSVAVQALRTWTASQADERLTAGDSWHDTGLVFTTHNGDALDAGNVRKMFKRICTEAGIGDSWTPRELRTSFVSLMSHQGVSIEEIARLVGHATTRTTEIVYRRELRPVITTGAEVMDQLFTTT